MSPIDDNLKQLGDLKEKVKGQWEWMSSATAPATKLIGQYTDSGDDSWLRQKVRESRIKLEESYGLAKESMASTTESLAASTSSITAKLDDAKVRALELRRQNPAVVVAGVTLLAMAPAYRSGPRALLRNAVVGGGAAAFFLYPEFIARTAPYVERASSDVSKHANQAAERLGLVKGSDEQ
jgi:hypothetical protein